MALIKVNNRGQSADFSTEIGATKNLIINGGFNVWQRGTSLSITTSNYRLADQWLNYPGSAGSGTVSRQSFALGQTDVPGEPTYYLRMDMTGAASSAPNIQQRIEDVRTAAGQEVTLSFYAKCGSGTVIVDPIIRQYFGTGGSPSASVNIYPTDITLTTSWQKFTRTFTMGSLSGKTLGTDNMHQIQIRLQLPTSATYTVDIAQVQLEVGDTATTFEHRSFGEELALCQRYYSKASQYGSAWNAGTKQQGSFASHGSSNGWFGPIEFPVTMRTIPTMQQTGTQSYNGSTWTSWSSVSMGARTENSCYADCSGGVSTSNGQSLLFQMYWEANAEL